MALTLSAAERALIASKIDFSKTTGRYAEAYREIVRISDARPIGQFALTSEEKYWYTKAAEINSDNQNSSANLAIRGITAAGLLWSSTQNSTVQGNSNKIGENVLNDVLGQNIVEGQPLPTFTQGSTPTLSQLLFKDVGLALSDGKQTLGGWGGSFYYWNYAAPGDDFGRTIGQVISSSPAELEKFLTVNAAALVAVARQEFDGPLSKNELLSVINGGFWAQAPLHIKQEVLFRAFNGKDSGNFAGDPSLIRLGDGTVWQSDASGGEWIRVDGGVGGLMSASPETKSALDAIRAIRLQNHENGQLGDIRSILRQELPRCFPGYTQIAQPDNRSKRIDAIDVGDTVLSFDPHANGGRGALLSGVVTKVFRNTTDVWLKLSFLDGGTLSATPGHHMLGADGRFDRLDHLVQWAPDGDSGRVTLVGESGDLRAARVETIRYSAATAHLYPLAGGIAGNASGIAANDNTKRYHCA